MADKLMVNIFKMEGTVMQTLKYKLEYLEMKPVLTHTKNTTTTIRGRRELMTNSMLWPRGLIERGLMKRGLPLYTLTSACIFSIQFLIYFSWQ